MTTNNRLDLLKEDTHVQCLNLDGLFFGSTQVGMFLHAYGLRKSSPQQVHRECAHMRPVDDFHAYAHILVEQQ